jgi:hypothetical protein
LYDLILINDVVSVPSPLVIHMFSFHRFTSDRTELNTICSESIPQRNSDGVATNSFSFLLEKVAKKQRMSNIVVESLPAQITMGDFLKEKKNLYRATLS